MECRALVTPQALIRRQCASASVLVIRCHVTNVITCQCIAWRITLYASSFPIMPVLDTNNRARRGSGASLGNDRVTCQSWYCWTRSATKAKSPLRRNSTSNHINLSQSAQMHGDKFCTNDKGAVNSQWRRWEFSLLLIANEPEGQSGCYVHWKLKRRPYASSHERNFWRKTTASLI